MLSLFPQIFFLEQLSPFILRLALGVIFASYGYIKLSQRKNKLSIAGGALELVGGLFVFLGLFTQLGAIFLIVDRLISVWKVKFSRGFIGGYDFDIALIAMATSLLFLGPGFFSIDFPF